MLVIRLQRTGRENLATYRVVVAEKSDAVKGGSLEIVGHYLPQRGIETFTVKQERIAYWMGKGARPSDTVARLLKRSGTEGLDAFIQRYTKQRPKKAPPEEPAAPAASAEQPVEAPSDAPAADSTPAEQPAADEKPTEAAVEEKPADVPAAQPAAEQAPADEPAPEAEDDTAKANG